jgi:8-oxo-dGTP pyrophosphatase MutT (NUDIX family)
MTVMSLDEDGEPRRQVGALPSRESRRWVIPKGWPMKGRKPFQAAAREAYEEAGLRGAIGKRPIGHYLYQKRLKNLDAVQCQVKVFPLKVRKQLKHFPEENQRDLRWFSPAEAAEASAPPAAGKTSGCGVANAAAIRYGPTRPDGHAPRGAPATGCGSSVVEHFIGNEEVESSILSRSTILIPHLGRLTTQAPSESRR